MHNDPADLQSFTDVRQLARGHGSLWARLRVVGSLLSMNGKMRRKWLLNRYLVSLDHLVSDHLRVCPALQSFVPRRSFAALSEWRGKWSIRCSRVVTASWRLSRRQRHEINLMLP